MIIITDTADKVTTINKPYLTLKENRMKAHKVKRNIKIIEIKRHFLHLFSVSGLCSFDTGAYRIIGIKLTSERDSNKYRLISQ